jgi:hypothetical protein
MVIEHWINRDYIQRAGRRSWPAGAVLPSVFRAKFVLRALGMYIAAFLYGYRWVV